MIVSLAMFVLKEFAQWDVRVPQIAQHLSLVLVTNVLTLAHNNPVDQMHNVQQLNRGLNAHVCLDFCPIPLLSLVVQESPLLV